MYSWVAQRNAAFDIDSTKMDAQDGSIATGLSTAICRDGQSTVIANIPWGGFKITGLDTPTASGDAATFDWVNGLISTTIPRGYLAGCTLSNDVSTPNTVLDISAGQATSDDATTVMTIGAFTKTTGVWAVGSGNGALDTGAVANNTWYHVYIIERIDTNVVDVLFSVSATAPTMPGSYTKKRRIGSIKTAVATTNILAFTQFGNEFLWAIPVQDINVTLGTTAAVTFGVTVPPGVQVNALLLANAASSVTGQLLLSALDQADNVPNTPLGNYNVNVFQTGIGISFPVNIRTNTSKQFRARGSNTAIVVTAVTNGWIDTRGQG